MERRRSDNNPEARRRRSRAREALLEILRQAPFPLSASEAGAFLAKEGFLVNKTTVYRALASFRDAGVLKEVRLADREVRYEPADRGHHHHLVCVGCRSVEDISLEEDFARQEERIATTRRFRVLDHALEFFGLCMKCQ
jgi:Fur family ferric uptake transcriptional regulator